MKRRHFLKASGGAALLGISSGLADAVETKPVSPSNVDGIESEENWMEGFPPNPDQIIQFNDGSYARFPQIRWSLCHIEELVPTRSVWRGSEPVSQLDTSDKDVFSLSIHTLDGRTMQLEEALKHCFTDGFLVLHKGKIASERYFLHCTPNTRHVIQSASKSFVGTLAEQLSVEGVLDKKRVVSHYLPELKQAAWKDARVVDVMDMLVGMQFDEDYRRPDSEVYRYLMAMGMLPHPPGVKAFRSVYQYLPNIPKEGKHNKAFAYREPNISVLGWLLRRVSGMSLADLVSERIWQPLGMERDAYFMVDGWGAEGTLSMTLRDFARFGKLILSRGQLNGRQIFSPEAIENCFKGGCVDKFAAGMNGKVSPSFQSYKSQWWVRHLEGRNALQARGAYGQSLYIDPQAEIVIARFGSAKTSPSADLDHIVTPMHDAIVKALSAP
ncbi:serine hydrolase domain-containing protein [Pseudoteredinibacter isoporae]|nr:serine hydrolase [Pseudoteredinibacter isoporae]